MQLQHYDFSFLPPVTHCTFCSRPASRRTSCLKQEKSRPFINFKTLKSSHPDASVTTYTNSLHLLGPPWTNHSSWLRKCSFLIGESRVPNSHLRVCGHDNESCHWLDVKAPKSGMLLQMSHFLESLSVHGIKLLIASHAGTWQPTSSFT